MKNVLKLFVLLFFLSFNFSCTKDTLINEVLEQKNDVLNKTSNEASYFLSYEDALVLANELMIKSELYYNDGLNYEGVEESELINDFWKSTETY